MSRSRILVAAVALISLTTTFTACGGGGGEDPQTVVDEATLQGIESANLDLALGMDVKGEEGGHLDVRLSGPFQRESEAELPEFDLSASAKGHLGDENVDFEGGFTLLGDKAYVGYQGTEYEVDSATFNFVRSLIKRRTGGKNPSSEVTACQEAASELKLSSLMTNLKSGGSADVDGTSTTKVSGDLDVGGAIDAAIELSENPACSEQLSATGALPSKAKLERSKREVEQALKSAHVDLYVGDDHIVRRVVAQATIEPKSGRGSEKVKGVSLEIDLKLSGVNEEQAIEAPPNSKPLSALFVKLGINPLELLGLLQGGAHGLNGPGGLNSLLERIGSGGLQ